MQASGGVTGLEGRFQGMNLQQSRAPVVQDRGAPARSPARVQTLVVGHMTPQEQQDAQAKVARVIKADKAIASAKATQAQAKTEEAVHRQAKEEARAKKEGCQAQATQLQGEIAQMNAQQLQVFTVAAGMVAKLRVKHGGEPAKVKQIDEFSASLAQIKATFPKDGASQQKVMLGLQRDSAALMKSLAA